jgi:hypothetical protein
VEAVDNEMEADVEAAVDNDVEDALRLAKGALKSQVGLIFKVILAFEGDDSEAELEAATIRGRF